MPISIPAAHFEVLHSTKHKSKLPPEQLYWLSFYIYIYIYIYIPWIIRDKSHLDIGIVNMDINATRQRRYNISTNKIFIHFLYFPSILYTRYGKRHVHNTNSYRNIYLKKIKNKQNIYSSIRYCGKYITNMCY